LINNPMLFIDNMGILSHQFLFCNKNSLKKQYFPHS